jgi:hypothetical protein
VRLLSNTQLAGQQFVTSEEKIELAELLEEKTFRREQGIKLELVRRIIGGVEQTILLVKLKLRPPVQ